MLDGFEHPGFPENPTALHHILKDTAFAFAGGHYYCALAVTLTLPDICAGLASQDGRTTRQKYMEWFDDHAAKEFRNDITGEDCYTLRCGIVHTGHFNLAYKKQRFRQILFNIRTEGGIFVPGLRVSTVGDEKDIVTFDLGEFCRTMDACVMRWFMQNQENSIVVENLKNLVHLREKGYSVFQGIPVIA